MAEWVTILELVMGRRVCRGRRWWQQAVEEQRGSDLTVAAFCRSRGVPVSTFYGWQARIRKNPRRRVARRNSSQMGTFVPLMVTPSEPAGAAAMGKVASQPLASSAAHVEGAQPIEVLLPGQVCLRVPQGCQRETLAMVLGLLEDRS